MRIPAILSGILTQLALYSVNLRIMGWGTTAGTQSTLAVSVDKYGLLVSSRFVRELALRNPILLLVVIAAVVVALLYWFFGTEIGCGIRATGANRNMARSQGINTERNAVIGLMISNGIVALAGALIAQYQGSSTVDMGRGAIVIGLAAVIIGEVHTRPQAQQLCREAGQLHYRRDTLLRCHPGGASPRAQHQRPQAAYGAHRRAVPRNTVLEG